MILTWIIVFIVLLFRRLREAVMFFELKNISKKLTSRYIVGTVVIIIK